MENDEKVPIWVKHILSKLDHVERLVTPLIAKESVKPAVYTISRAAEKYRISRNTISKAIKNEELHCESRSKGKGGTRIRCDVFEKWYFNCYCKTK